MRVWVRVESGTRLGGNDRCLVHRSVFRKDAKIVKGVNRTNKPLLMIEQLSIFDLPPAANPPQRLFDHQRLGASFPSEKIYTKRGKIIVDGKYKRRRTCCVCGTEFYSSDGGKAALTCSGKCREIKRHYGSIEQKEKITANVIELLELGLTNKEIAKKLNLCITVVKNLAFDKYQGVSPIHARAIQLYKDGKSEDEIAATLSKNKASVITWLMYNIDGYTPPKTYEKKNKQQKKKDDRKRIALLLKMYKRVRSVRKMAIELGIGDEAIRTALRKTKAWKREQQKNRSGEYTKAKKKLRRISAKYKNENDFCDALERELSRIGITCYREYKSGKTTNIDFLILRSGRSAVIECKFDVKITLIHKAAGQAAIAAKKLKTNDAFVCYPDDVDVSSEGISDCQLLGVKAMNEAEIVDYLSSHISSGAVCQN